jgi:hypothetical protein
MKRREFSEEFMRRLFWVLSTTLFLGGVVLEFTLARIGVGYPRIILIVIAMAIVAGIVVWTISRQADEFKNKFGRFPWRRKTFVKNSGDNLGIAKEKEGADE